MGLDARIPVFRGLQTTQAQTSLRIRRPACASAESDQHLCYSLFAKYHMYILLQVLFYFSILVSSATETGLKLALSETLKTGFLPTKPIYKDIYDKFMYNTNVTKTQITPSLCMIIASHRQNIIAMTGDFQQCGLLTKLDSDEPVQPPFKLRNSK